MAAFPAHHPGVVLAQRMGCAIASRAAGREPPRRFPLLDEAVFHDGFAAVLGGLPQARLAHCIRVPVDQPPWLDTGIDVVEGEWLGWFANGEVVLSPLLDIRFGADFQLWARIGTEGTIFRATRNSHTFRAARAGRLYLASLFPGAWATPAGALLPGSGGYAGTKGALALWLLHWRDEPSEDLRLLRAAWDPAGIVSGEIDRRAAADALPPGWSHLWALGESEIHRATGDGCIACRTRADVAILQRDVDLPLLPGTRLAWEWRVDALPSRLAENTLPTHDYISIAVEFDNGIDITWYWSAALPCGFGYWCPLPTWESREYHVVIRSGEAGFGEWLPESRDIHADYAHYIGTPPARIVRVWLIAVSLFQRQVGSCDFRAMRIVQGDREITL